MSNHTVSHEPYPDPVNPPKLGFFEKPEFVRGVPLTGVTEPDLYANAPRPLAETTQRPGGYDKTVRAISEQDDAARQQQGDRPLANRLALLRRLAGGKPEPDTITIPQVSRPDLHTQRMVSTPFDRSVRRDLQADQLEEVRQGVMKAPTQLMPIVAPHNQPNAAPLSPPPVDIKTIVNDALSSATNWNAFAAGEGGESVPPPARPAKLPQTVQWFGTPNNKAADGDTPTQEYPLIVPKPSRIANWVGHTAAVETEDVTATAASTGSSGWFDKSTPLVPKEGSDLQLRNPDGTRNILSPPEAAKLGTLNPTIMREAAAADHYDLLERILAGLRKIDPHAKPVGDKKVDAPIDPAITASGDAGKIMEAMEKAAREADPPRQQPAA